MQPVVLLSQFWPSQFLHVWSKCCFLTCMQVFRETDKVIGDPHLFKTFPQFVVIHTVTGFSIVNKAEVDVFLEFPCFLHDTTNVGNLISGTSASSKPSMYICKFLVHVLLKPSLKDFEHNLNSLWNENNCMVVWTFFGIALLWDWNETDFFQSSGDYWVFPIVDILSAAL